jgi:hypothetical protein
LKKKTDIGMKNVSNITENCIIDAGKAESIK